MSVASLKILLSPPSFPACSSPSLCCYPSCLLPHTVRVTGLMIDQDQIPLLFVAAQVAQVARQEGRFGPAEARRAYFQGPQEL